MGLSPGLGMSCYVIFSSTDQRVEQSVNVYCVWNVLMRMCFCLGGESERSDFSRFDPWETYDTDIVPVRRPV